MSESAAIICTRNRPEALSRTITSIEALDDPNLPQLIVVDASNTEIAEKNERRLTQTSSLSSTYLSYTASPSSARQRNYGLENLPSDAEIVFFLDDDVTLKSGYFRKIIALFNENPQVLGVGGFDLSQKSKPPVSFRQFMRYFFLLDHPQPGRILPSGEATPPHRTRSDDPIPVQWLAGFTMAYRRSILAEEQFDDRLEGYSHYEDRDLAVRIRRHGRLMVHPGAHLIHRRASKNRYDAAEFQYSTLTHLYWFIEKSIQHPLKKPSFWWATFGRFLATLLSSDDQKWDSLRGLQKGIWAVMNRSHPLLEK